jgi:hypothetical protein
MGTKRCLRPRRASGCSRDGAQGRKRACALLDPGEQVGRWDTERFGDPYEHPEGRCRSVSRRQTYDSPTSRACASSRRSAQLEVLLAQPADLLTLLAGEHLAAFAAIGFDLAHRLAQHFTMDTQIGSDMRDRTLRLKREANTALDQLQWILPRSWHDKRLSPLADKTAKQSLRQTQPGSSLAQTQPGSLAVEGSRSAGVAYQ